MKIQRRGFLAAAGAALGSLAFWRTPPAAPAPMPTRTLPVWDSREAFLRGDPHRLEEFPVYPEPSRWWVACLANAQGFEQAWVVVDGMGCRIARYRQAGIWRHWPMPKVAHAQPRKVRLSARVDELTPARILEEEGPENRLPSLIPFEPPLVWGRLSLGFQLVTVVRRGVNDPWRRWITTDKIGGRSYIRLGLPLEQIAAQSFPTRTTA